MNETTTLPATRQPIAERPRVPAAYGVPRTAKGLLGWSHLEQRLTDARVYWIATSGPGGRPRVRPVDGLYLEGVIYLGGSPETRWNRDIEANPQVAVHLDDGSDVVIVEGIAELLDQGAGPELAERLAAASNAKFPEYGMTAASYAEPGTLAIRPRVAFGWTNFPSDVTRFRFG
jgi:nitroimidazol reductase NimA-like FMN-containing flavoprotein (pyridoxamine 5'-phosphate oxidase superfamily)